MVKIRITVNTPKNQAHKCIKTQRRSIIGLGHQEKVIEEKVVKHNQFYWIVKPKDDKDLQRMIKKAAAGEVTIRKFYSGLFHIISKANKLCAKFDKGVEWVRRFIIKRLKKVTQFKGDDDKDNLINKVKTMSQKDLKEFIVIHDKEEMQKMLKGDLIIIEEIES